MPRASSVLPMLLVGGLAACPAASTTPSVEPRGGTGESQERTAVGTTTSTRPPPDTPTGTPVEAAPTTETTATGDGETPALSPALEQPVVLPDVSAPTKDPAGGALGKGPRDERRTGASSGPGTGLVRDDIQRVVRGQQQRLRSCYDRLLVSGPEPSAGSVSIRFTIEPSGTVDRAEIASATITDPAFLECVRGVVRGMRFPTTDGPTVVTYPFRFEPGAGGE